MVSSANKLARTLKKRSRAMLKISESEGVLINGLRDVFDGDVSAVIARMREGTPARVILVLAANLGIGEPCLLDLLRLSKNHVKGRMSTGNTLSAIAQDRAYRASRVFRRAVVVLGDKESAQKWLLGVNRSLGAEVPLALLDTEVGYELVLDTLGRIEYGVVS